MGKRDLISISDLSKAEIEMLFKQAKLLKEEVSAGKFRRTLEGRTLAMIFEKPSTRTRVGFEAGMTQLGGHAQCLLPTETQIGQREPFKDAARVLAAYCDAILVRTFAHRNVIDLAQWSEAPIINGLSDLLHPCQVLSDLFTIDEHFGSLEGIPVAYVGDGNNVANSWALGASRMGLPLAIACPEGHDPDPEVLAQAMEGTGASIEVMRDPQEAVEGARVVYTDVWASMGQEHKAKERQKIFAPYQINESLMKHAASEAVVMHCLPAHRGEEITDDVVEGPQSIIFTQAANRLHVQKAIMEWLMKGFEE